MKHLCSYRHIAAAIALWLSAGSCATSFAQMATQGLPGSTGPAPSATEPWHPLRELMRVWDGIEMGSTPDQTIKLVGLAPLSQDSSVSLGVTITTLTWKDAWGGIWSAHFVFNRLVRKSASRAN